MVSILSGWEGVFSRTNISPSEFRVAGAVALLKQMHPTLTPEEIKSALVLSADRPSTLSSLSSMIRGGGSVNVLNAVTSPIVTTPATISFGKNTLYDTTTLTKTVTIKNVTDQSQTVSLSTEFQNQVYISSVSIEPNQFELSPSDSIEVTIDLQVTPPQQLLQESNISGDLLITVDGSDSQSLVPIWLRIVNVAAPEGQILLVDDDKGTNTENKYTQAIEDAGYISTTWSVETNNAYPTKEYMQQFNTVVWVMVKKSLVTETEAQYITAYNERTRFQVELTKYLALGGNALLSGMDWSDYYDTSSFGSQVMHISQFSCDPFISYNFRGFVQYQVANLQMYPVSNSPIQFDSSSFTANFDSTYYNFADIVETDQSGIVQPVLYTNEDPAGTLGIAIDSASYRYLFYSFPLERMKGNGLNEIMKTAWTG
jgi:hypothetical protein